MTGLNEFQASHVSASFAHVDELLQSIESSARAAQSPFSTIRADLDGDAVRLMESYIALARSRMLASLDRLGIPRPEPKVASSWSAETALQFADISLSELDAGTLRGYGPVDATVAEEVTALAADLRELLRRAREVLHDADPGGLTARVASVAGPVGEVLREVERISAAQGIAEVRPLIAAAAERAESHTFDVGVFGRVSAGKSSLINALAGTPALPVGATAVTAVPLRIGRGSDGALVHLMDGGSRAISLAEVPAFATEERNPQNRLGVRSIEITVPTVADGVRFLDTPGVGSLGTSGPAQAFAWLPRCDLGLVLIAPAGPVARDDLSLLSGLRHAGIACRVLLSKCDLVPSDELERVLGYVASELRAAIGPVADAEPIVPVSTQAAESARLMALRREVIEPLAVDHLRAARRALAARLHALIGACGSALAGRTGPAEDRRIGLSRARVAATERIRRESAHLRTLAPVALEVAAQTAAQAWAKGDARAGVRLVLMEAAGGALDVVRRAVDEARAAPHGSDARATRIPPLFDPALLDDLPDLKRPRVILKALLRVIAARRLRVIEHDLDDALNAYASRLEAWGLGLLDDLTADAWTGTHTEPGADPRLQRLDQLVREWEAEGA
jgi:GTP-binding protein EngB required for normal cell division